MLANTVRLGVMANATINANRMSETDWIARSMHDRGRSDAIAQCDGYSVQKVMQVLCGVFKKVNAE